MVVLVVLAVEENMAWMGDWLRGRVDRWGGCGRVKMGVMKKDWVNKFDLIIAYCFI